jgi:hypothetical protein
MNYLLLLKYQCPKKHHFTIQDSHLLLAAIKYFTICSQIHYTWIAIIIFQDILLNSLYIYALSRGASMIVSAAAPHIDNDYYLENFCKQVLTKDYFIKSAKIADHIGHIIASAHRPNSVDIMTSEENSRAAAQAAIRAATRDKFKPKLGELLFSLSRYENEVRATVPIKEGNDHNGSDGNSSSTSSTKNRFLLLLSLDVDAEADHIILKKVLPLIKDNKDYLL